MESSNESDEEKSSSLLSQTDLRGRGKQKKKGRKWKKGLPTTVMKNSLSHLSEYVTQHKDKLFNRKSIEDFGKEEQDKIVESLKFQEIWNQLHALWKKKKGNQYWTTYSRKIVLYLNNRQGQEIILAALKKYNFTTESIRKICPYYDEECDKNRWTTSSDSDLEQDHCSDPNKNAEDQLLFSSTPLNAVDNNTHELSQQQLQNDDSSDFEGKCEYTEPRLHGTSPEKEIIGHTLLSFNQMDACVNDLASEFQETFEALKVQVIVHPQPLNANMKSIFIMKNVGHWILIEVDVKETVIKIHDPESLTTSPEIFQRTIIEVETYINSQLGPALRLLQIIKLDEDAMNFAMHSDVYCLNIIRSRFNTKISPATGQEDSLNLSDGSADCSSMEIDDLDSIDLPLFPLLTDSMEISSSGEGNVLDPQFSNADIEGHDSIFSFGASDSDTFQLGVVSTHEKEQNPCLVGTSDDDECTGQSSNQHSSDDCDDDAFISMEGMCSILGVDKSILKYTPPTEFSINIPSSDCEKMLHFQEYKTKDGGNYWDVKFRKHKWAAVLSKHLSRSQIPCSFSASHGIVYADQQGDQGGIDDQLKRMSTFAYCYGHCSGGCEMEFTVVFQEKPLIGQDLSCVIRTKGSFNLVQEQPTTRRLSGTEREDIQKLLRHHKANKIFLENLSHLSALQLLHGNKFVKSESVLRTARSQEKRKNRTDSNEINDLCNIMVRQRKEECPQTKLPGYLRQIQRDPFHYELMMWPQVKLTNSLAQKLDIWLTVDASGRICHLPHEPNLEKKKVFNYVVDVTVDSEIEIPSYTLSEMVTTNNRATNVKSFLSRTLDEIKKSGAPIENLIAGVVSDMSMALIHANCEAVNVETFNNYITRTYDILAGKSDAAKNKAVIFICTNHLMNAFRKNIQHRSLKKNVKNLALSMLARIQECCDLDSFEYFSKRAICLLGKETMDQKKLDKFTENVQAKNLARIDFEENDDVLDFEEDVENFEKQKSGKFSVLKSENPYYENFFNLRRKLCPELPVHLPKKSLVKEIKKSADVTTIVKESDSEEAKNPYYCTQILELLENTYIPMVPFFSAMVPRKCGFLDFLRKTNGIVESTFNVNKTGWHLNRNMHNGDFVREHFDLIKGRVLRSWGVVNDNRRKLGVSKVSLDNAIGKGKGTSKATTDTLCSHEAEETWKPKSTSQKNPSGLNHLSDPVKFNKNKQQMDKQKNLNEDKLKQTQELVNLLKGLAKTAPVSSPITSIEKEIYIARSAHDAVSTTAIQSLVGGDKWICDQVMDVYARNLVDSYSQLTEAQRHLGRVDLLPSYGIYTDKNGKMIVTESAFQRLADDIDTIFMPLNLMGIHWILVQIENIMYGKKYLTTFDSKTNTVKTSKLTEYTEKLMTEIDIRYGSRGWVTFDEDTVQQVGSTNCGSSVLFILDKTLNQNLAPYLPEELDRYREEVLIKLLETTDLGKEILARFTGNEGLQGKELINFILTKETQIKKMGSNYAAPPLKKPRKSVYFDDN